MTTNQQLELGFNGQPIRALGRRRPVRMARAKWWFAQMRAAVENAMDWPSPDETQPEQMWIADANGQIKA